MAAKTDSGSQESAPLGVYTETLARLYWRQGYLDEALRIYRHLADEHPDNPHFQDRICALKQQQEMPPEVASAEPVAALQSGRLTALEVRQAQHVIARLESWLNCLQRQRRA